MKTTKQIIDRALNEDRAGKDITTRALIPAGLMSRARIVAKEDLCVCGIEVAKQVFRRLDARMAFQHAVKDGQCVRKGQALLEFKGNTRVLLSTERVALNFLAHLSAITTQTRRFVMAVKKTNVKIYDTRKTTPGLRALEKYAVTCAGGMSHRFDLNEMVLIKDNHHQALAKTMSFSQAIQQARAKTMKPLMVEVETIAQFKEALSAGADLILLDNMTPAQIKHCVALKKKKAGRKPLIEVSGGVNLSNVQQYARCGIDRISIGALTHSAPAVDISMEVCP